MSHRVSDLAKQAIEGLLDKLSRTSLPVALGLRHSIFRLAKEFEQAHSRAPSSLELESELRERTGTDGKIAFYYNEIAKPEKTYAEIYETHMPRGLQPVHLNRYETCFGDKASVHKWVRSDEAKNYKDIEKKLVAHVSYYQIEAAEIVLAHAATFLPNELYAQLIVSVKNLCKDNCTVLPQLDCDDWFVGEENEKKLEKLERFAARWHIPIDAAFGLQTFMTGRPSDPPFDNKEYMKIRNFLCHEQDSVDDLNYASAIAAITFKTYRNFTKFCERWPNFINGDLALLDNLFIDEYSFYPDAAYAQWGEAAIKYGPKMLFYLKYADLIDELPRDKNNQILFHQSKTRIFERLIEEEKENIDWESFDLYKFCFENQLSEKEYKAAHYLVANYGGIKTPDNIIPSVTVEGKDFGMEGYTFRRLEYDDFRILFPGKYTGCCERLFEYCQNSVLHSYITRESGFYVLTDPKDNIVAHSWVWRTDAGDFVFDGFEARQNDKRITDDLIQNMLYCFTEECRSPEYDDYNIQRILIGESGKKLSPEAGMDKANLPDAEDEFKWMSPTDQEVFTLMGTHLGFSNVFYIVDNNEPLSPPPIIDYGPCYPN